MLTAIAILSALSLFAGLLLLGTALQSWLRARAQARLAARVEKTLTLVRAEVAERPWYLDEYRLDPTTRAHQAWRTRQRA